MSSNLATAKHVGTRFHQWVGNPTDGKTYIGPWWGRCRKHFGCSPFGFGTLLALVGLSTMLVPDSASGAGGVRSDSGRSAVEALQNQRTFFTTRVSQMVLDGFLDREKSGGIVKTDDSTTDVLTSREREVIQLLAEGKTSKEVAVALNLSVKTAETHRTNLMRKLGLHSVADLTRYAVRNGIVQVF